MDNTVCGRCSISKITQFTRCIFSKYNWNNSAGQGLKWRVKNTSNAMISQTTHKTPFLMKISMWFSFKNCLYSNKYYMYVLPIVEYNFVK